VSSIRVDVWFLWTGECPQEIDLTESSTGFSSQELARAARYRLPAKRRQFLLSRFLGRRIIASMLSIAPEEIDWPSTGAPRLQSHAAPVPTPLPLSVSLSHTGEWIVLAVSQADVSLGIDVEETRSPLSVAALAAMTFTQSERLLLAEIPREQQTGWARQLWTAKEAVLKSLEQETPPEMSSVDLSDRFIDHQFRDGSLTDLNGNQFILTPVRAGRVESDTHEEWAVSLDSQASFELTGTLVVRFPRAAFSAAFRSKRFVLEEVQSDDCEERFHPFPVSTCRSVIRLD